MRIILRALLFFIILFLHQFMIAQTTVPYYDLQGKWIKGHDGIKVEFDRIVILQKQGDWKLSSKPSDVYTFINEPIINDSKVFETWVVNNIITEITLSDNIKHKVNTKQYRLIKIEINNKGKLDFYISNTIRNYENEPEKYWMQKPSNTQFPTRLTFKRYIDEKATTN